MLKFTILLSTCDGIVTTLHSLSHYIFSTHNAISFSLCCFTLRATKVNDLNWSQVWRVRRTVHSRLNVYYTRFYNYLPLKPTSTFHIRNAKKCENGNYKFKWPRTDAVSLYSYFHSMEIGRSQMERIRSGEMNKKKKENHKIIRWRMTQK